VINSITPYAVVDGLTYIIDPVINNILERVPIIPNSNNLIWGSVTKTTKTTCNVVPYQGEYLRKWKTNHALVYSSLESADDNSVYFYGTGNTVRKLLQMLPTKHRCKIAGLISKDTDEIGRTLYGYKVFEIDKITDSNSIVVIATIDRFQDIIYNRIKHIEDRGVRIICL